MVMTVKIFARTFKQIEITVAYLRHRNVTVVQAAGDAARYVGGERLQRLPRLVRLSYLAAQNEIGGGPDYR